MRRSYWNCTSALRKNYPNPFLVKIVRAMAEKMVTLGKREDLHAKRQVYGFITKESVANIYARKSRLKSRIKAAGTPHTDLFLSLFG